MFGASQTETDERASFQFGDCHATYWLRPVQGAAVVFAFFGKDFAADPGNSRRQHHANASERVCQRPSRGVAISLSLRRPSRAAPKASDR